MLQLKNADGTDSFCTFKKTPVYNFFELFGKIDTHPSQFLSVLPEVSLTQNFVNDEFIHEASRITLIGTESRINFCQCRLLFLDFFRQLFHGDFPQIRPYEMEVVLDEIALKCFQNFVCMRFFTKEQANILIKNYNSLIQLVFFADYLNFEMLIKWCVNLLYYLEFLDNIENDFERLWYIYLCCRRLVHIKDILKVMGKVEAFLCLFLRKYGEDTVKSFLNLGIEFNRNAFNRIKVFTYKRFFFGGLVTCEKLVSIDQSESE